MASDEIFCWLIVALMVYGYGHESIFVCFLERFGNCIEVVAVYAKLYEFLEKKVDRLNKK